MAKFLFLGILLSLGAFIVLAKPPGPNSPLQGLKKQPCSGATCEAEAKTYLEGAYETESSDLCQKAVLADWTYNTDLGNPANADAVAAANIAYANFQFKAWNETLRLYEFELFSDPSVKRQLEFLNIVGIAALNEADLARYNEILAEMSRIYGTAKICPYEKQVCDLATEGLNLEPEIEQIIATSRDSAKLAYTWKAWRDAAGKPIKEMYREYIALSNKAAVLNGLKDNGDLWLARYEAEDFRQQVGDVWNGVKELYQEVYAYVRYRLQQQYPDDIKEADDPIPAHLLGNMWSQTWEPIYELVKPHADAAGFDVTAALQARFSNDYDGVFQLFELANKFFMDLNLSDMSMAYSEKAMIVRPADKEVVCHASAWDFCDGEDYRIKMCTNVDQEDFITIHHELGHIQYFMNYKNQPITFRDGANPGFHEAIGDVISLSVATPKHMKTLDLIESGELDEKTTINFLMQKALEKIAFLPFGYLIDAYRWRLFDGTITEDRMEYEWLKIRNEIEGVIPPVMRSEMDFDAGAKYHVPGNTPYIRYFVSFIIQFQIHKALCIQAGEYDESDPTLKPMYNCDINGSPEAGAVMKTLLEKGFADNWQDILEAATGSRVMDASAITEYFKPLMDYLQAQRAEIGYLNTWKTDAFEALYSADPSVTTTPQPSSSSPASSSSSPGSSSSSLPSTTDSSERSDKISGGLIAVGIVQGGLIAAVSIVYVVKTFILKK